MLQLWNTLVDAIEQLLSFDRSVYEVVLLSLRVSGLATLIAAAFGIPLGMWLGLTRNRSRAFLAAGVNTGLGLPPVVVGLVIFLVLSRRGPLGSLDLLFTPGAMIIAQVIIASPYIIALTMAAVASVPKDVRLQAQGLGASRFQALLLVVKSARVSLMAAVVAGFGAVISEVGAVMIVGGNIAQTDKNVTRVMTTDIVRRVSQGDYGGALALGMVLIGVAFLIVLVLTRQQLGKKGRWVSS